MFVAPTKWLIIQNVNTDETGYVKMQNKTKIKSSLHNVFENLDVYPDSEVFLGQRKINNNTFELYSLYRPSPYRNLIIENRGSWNENDGFLLINHYPSSRRRRNLQQTPLKSCLVVGLFFQIIVSPFFFFLTQ